jgi:hypothetical protein
MENSAQQLFVSEDNAQWRRYFAKRIGKVFIASTRLDAAAAIFEIHIDK